MDATRLTAAQYRRAVVLIVLIGCVSLFADMTYEGGRSVAGPFLGTLGASAVVVSVIAGLGEFLGYGVRYLSGRAADRSGRYWPLMLAGYTVNLLSVPLLALAGAWPVAMLLLIAERVGRAIRVPIRDAMLSHAASRTGAGWAFGLHTALDQTGGMIGPLLIALLLALGRRLPVRFRDPAGAGARLARAAACGAPALSRSATARAARRSDRACRLVGLRARVPPVHHRRCADGGGLRRFRADTPRRAVPWRAGRGSASPPAPRRRSCCRAASGRGTATRYAPNPMLPVNTAKNPSTDPAITCGKPPSDTT